uniref:Uncharacterized protein n=1 Tax=Glossina brevipalpis TaxID=37001 RepID=A0A1A9WFZ3_9MUSC
MGTKCYEIRNLKKFCKNILIYDRFNEKNEVVYSYESILKIVENVLQYFQKHNNDIKSLLCFVFSILNNNCRFYAFNNDSDRYMRRNIKSGEIAYVFTTKLVDLKEMFLCHLPKLKVLNETYFVIKLKTTILNLKDLSLCYSIATSGSTGESKLVHVPYESIQPNITSLSSLLKIEASDIIFLGSPVTFDPFVVEFFLALANGAALLITSTKVRLSSNRLGHILFSPKAGLKGVSIFQTTPSLFRLFDKQIIQNVIFDKNSALRCLILGGEEFPCYGEISNWLPGDYPNSEQFNKRIFNVYGVTEVSCWSTIYELDFRNQYSAESSIPLGDVLGKETVLRIIDKKGRILSDDNATGELRIGSATRCCYIPQFDQHPNNRKHSIIFRNTGDLVKRDGGGNIYYLGRLNNIIKRLGKRLCLDALSQRIENILRKIGVTSKVLCLWSGETNRLILCVEVDQNEFAAKNLIPEMLRNSLDNFEEPDKIYTLPKMPLTTHGKVDRFQVMNIISALDEKKGKTPLEIFKDFLRNVIGINDELLTGSGHVIQQNIMKRPKFVTNLSFNDAGGTSFQAISLVTEIGYVLSQPIDQPSLLEMLLDTSVTINDIINFLTSLGESEIKVSKALTPRVTRRLFKTSWAANLYKCVDASPSLYQEKVVAVGSHSHLLLVLNANDGKEISRLTVMDRIECPVLFITNQSAVVGCYDGFLYAFDFRQGSIEWRINAGGIIKAKPLQVAEMLLVASYANDFNVLAISLAAVRNSYEQKEYIIVSDSLQDVVVKWRLKIGTKGIFSSPLKVDEELCLICTLDGTYSLLRTGDGSVIWSHQMKSPIFSTPTLIKCPKQSLIAIAEVRGKVSMCEANTGQIISTFTAEGNIFSSFAVYYQDITHVSLIFGCYDKNVYCLNFTTTTHKFSLTWKISLNAPIYSTPILLSRMQKDNPDVLICATNGSMVLANLKSALQHSFYNLEAEIFSTPCFVSNANQIIVGSRNNYLQAFNIQ